IKGKKVDGSWLFKESELEKLKSDPPVTSTKKRHDTDRMTQGQSVMTHAAKNDTHNNDGNVVNPLEYPEVNFSNMTQNTNGENVTDITKIVSILAGQIENLSKQNSELSARLQEKTSELSEVKGELTGSKLLVEELKGQNQSLLGQIGKLGELVQGQQAITFESTKAKTPPPEPEDYTNVHDIQPEQTAKTVQAKQLSKEKLLAKLLELKQRGLSYAEIAQELNKQKILSAGGSAWTSNSVRKSLARWDKD
ncbi:MAG: recombinase family protein, partial [Desulfovibrio sp.]|uniref:recombinase family protein n=1 Tax=Desulfovibrio sp. 7SRBS1 TaxID=3378064 RepID=UPI003B4045E6